MVSFRNHEYQTTLGIRVLVCHFRTDTTTLKGRSGVKINLAAESALSALHHFFDLRTPMTSGLWRVVKGALLVLIGCLQREQKVDHEDCVDLPALLFGFDV